MTKIIRHPRSFWFTVVATLLTAGCGAPDQAGVRADDGADGRNSAPAAQAMGLADVNLGAALDVDAASAPPLGGDIQELQGMVNLGTKVANRTVVVGDLSNISDLSDILGAVLEIRGTGASPTTAGTAAAACQRPRAVDIIQLSGRSLLRRGVEIKTKALADVWFNDVIQRQAGVDVGYLAFASKLSNEDRAEVLIQDVASQAINFDMDLDSTRLARLEATPLPTGVCGRYVITRVVATTVQHRTYSNRRMEGGLVAVLNIGGRTLRSKSRQENELIVAIEPRPIDYTPAGQPAGTTVTSPPPPRTLPLNQ